MKRRRARAPMRSPQKPHGISAYIAGREEYEAAWTLLLEKVARARRRGTTGGRIVQNGGVGFVRTRRRVCRLTRAAMSAPVAPSTGRSTAPS